MSIDLSKAGHATETRKGKRGRQKEWTNRNRVDRFYASKDCDRNHHETPFRFYEAGFGCPNKWMCFSLRPEDFINVIKHMLTILPLEKLLALSTFITSLIADEVAKRATECRELKKAKSDLRAR